MVLWSVWRTVLASVLLARCRAISVDTPAAFGSAIDRLPEQEIVVLTHLDLTVATVWQRGDRDHYYELNAVSPFTAIDIRGQCCGAFKGFTIGSIAMKPGQCHLVVPIGIVFSIQKGVSLLLDNLFISEDPSVIAGSAWLAGSAQGTFGPGLLLQVHPGAEVWMVQVALQGNGGKSQAMEIKATNDDSAYAVTSGSVFMTNCSVAGFDAPGERTGVVYNEGFLAVQETMFVQNSANASTSGVITTSVPPESSQTSVYAITRVGAVYFDDNDVEYDMLKLATAAVVAADDFDVPDLAEVVASGDSVVVSYDRLTSKDVEKLPSVAQSRFGEDGVMAAYVPEICSPANSRNFGTYLASAAGVVAFVVIAIIAKAMYSQKAGFNESAGKRKRRRKKLDAEAEAEEGKKAAAMSGEVGLPGLPSAVHAVHVMQSARDFQDARPHRPQPRSMQLQPQNSGLHVMAVHSSGEARSQHTGSWPTHDMGAHAHAHPMYTHMAHTNTWTRGAVPTQGGSSMNTMANSMNTDYRQAAQGVVDALDELCEAQEPFMGKYKVQGSIAQRVGGQGCVQFVTHLHTGQEYAVKFFLNNTAFEAERRLYERPELRRMMPATKEVVPNEDGAIQSPSGFTFPPSIVIEKGQSLEEFARDLDRAEDGTVASLAQLTMLQAIIFVADRLHQLHRSGFVHRDIKPGNILRLPQQHAWTLIDFGSTVPIGEPAKLSFTLHYAPPEVIHTYESGTRTLVASPAVDVWALGVVAWEVLTGKPVLPPSELSAQEIRDRIAGRVPLPWEAPGASHLLRRLGRLGRTVMACLNRDPERRPSAASVVASWNDMYSTMTAAYSRVTT